MLAMIILYLAHLRNNDGIPIEVYNYSFCGQDKYSGYVRSQIIRQGFSKYTNLKWFYGAYCATWNFL